MQFATATLARRAACMNCRDPVRATGLRGATLPPFGVNDRSVCASWRTGHASCSGSSHHRTLHDEDALTMKPNSTLRLRPMALAVLALVGGLSLGACNRQENPAETSRDMSEERAEGNENVADATKDAAENLNDGASASTVVNDAHKIEVEKIRADHDVAKERCDGVPAPDQSKCRADADAAYDSAMKAADAKLKAVQSGGTTTPMGPP
jgi:hypothetical protein